MLVARASLVGLTLTVAAGAGGYAVLGTSPPTPSEHTDAVLCVVDVAPADQMTDCPQVSPTSVPSVSPTSEPPVSEPSVPPVSAPVSPPSAPPVSEPGEPPEVVSAPLIADDGATVALPCTQSVEYLTFLRAPGRAPDPCSFVVGCGEPAGGCDPALRAGPQRRTWKFPITTKLYIASFKPTACGQTLWVKLDLPTRLAPWITYCALTANTFNENPAKPDKPNPLDARIWAQYAVEFTCEAGKAVPVAGSVKSAGTASGVEGPGLSGVVHDPKVRDNIATNGTFGLVTSGRPDIKAEPTFVAGGGPRLNNAIFNKVAGTVVCSTGANGIPDSTINPVYGGSGFPSHRFWWGDTVGAEMAQADFSVLWDLPVPPDA